MSAEPQRNNIEWLGPEIAECWLCDGDGCTGFGKQIDACALCAAQAEQDWQSRLINVEENRRHG